MADVYIYDPVTDRVLERLTSVDTVQYEGRNDILINPELIGNTFAHEAEYLVVNPVANTVSVGDVAAIDAAKEAAKLAADKEAKRDYINIPVKNLLQSISKTFVDLDLYTQEQADAFTRKLHENLGIE